MSNLNKALLIGRLTKDPEMRYTPSGTAVTSFSIATNRWSTGPDGERKEFTDYHNIVAYPIGKRNLAETVAQLAPQWHGRRPGAEPFEVNGESDDVKSLRRQVNGRLQIVGRETAVRDHGVGETDQAATLFATAKGVTQIATAEGGRRARGGAPLRQQTGHLGVRPRADRTRERGQLRQQATGAVQDEPRDEQADAQHPKSSCSQATAVPRRRRRNLCDGRRRRWLDPCNSDGQPRGLLGARSLDGGRR